MHLVYPVADRRNSSEGPAAHAFWLLDSYVYGHVIQETSMPINTSDETTDSAGSILQQDTIDEYPHLVEIGEHAQRSTFTFDSEFEFGLDLILDALERTATPAVQDADA